MNATFFRFPIFLILSITACAQEANKGPINVGTPARQDAPVISRDLTSSRGPSITNYFVNGPWEGKTATSPASQPSTPAASSITTTPNSAQLVSADGRFVQTISFGTLSTTGDQSLTPTANTSAQTTQNPSTTGTVTANPSQTPTASVAVPITLAGPLGQATGQASPSAAGPGANAAATGGTQSPTQDIQIKLLAQLSAQLQTLLAQQANAAPQSAAPTATHSPASRPAPTSNPTQPQGGG